MVKSRRREKLTVEGFCVFPTPDFLEKSRFPREAEKLFSRPAL